MREADCGYLREACGKRSSRTPGSFGVIDYVMSLADDLRQPSRQHDNPKESFLRPDIKCQGCGSIDRLEKRLWGYKHVEHTSSRDVRQGAPP